MLLCCQVALRPYTDDKCHRGCALLDHFMNVTLVTVYNDLSASVLCLIRMGGSEIV